MQELEKIIEKMKEIKDGNRKEKLYAKYPPNSKDQEVLNAYSQGYEDGTDNFYNATAGIIRKHMNDDLISRKALIEEIQSFRCSITGLRAGKGVLAHVADEYRKSILQIIDEQPAAFDKEKVIENLTNLANAEVDMSDDEPEFADVEDFFDEGRSQGRFEAYRNSLEIVKKGGIK